MNIILTALDGSALAESVLPHVTMLAQVLSARIHLLRVVSEADQSTLTSEGAASALASPAAPDVNPALSGRRQAESYLAALSEKLVRDGFDVQAEVRVGPPPETIVEVAEVNQAVLIAMATHGYSGLRRWTLGSVTDRVAHLTTTPVLIVRGVAQAEAPRQLSRILVPLDGSPLSLQALPLASALAQCANAEIELLSAVVPPIVIEPTVGILREEDGTLMTIHNVVQQELDSHAGDLRSRGLKVSTVIVDGFAADAIVDEALRREAGLIVMATHGYSGLRRWALGSVADKVLHAASTPLILVRSR